MRTPMQIFTEFFEDEYRDELYQLFHEYPHRKTFEIDYKLLELYDMDLADLIELKPEDCIDIATKAIIKLNSTNKDLTNIQVRFKTIDPNLPGIRHLLAEHLGNLVVVDGVVKKVSDIIPKISKGAFECMGCMRMIEIEQPEDADKNIVGPSLCPDCGGRKFSFKQRESAFIDTQIITIQEPQEHLSGREQPRMVKIIVDGELVNNIAPGALIRVIGILKTKQNDRKIFYYYVKANNVEFLAKEFEEVDITPDDEKIIKEMAADPCIYENLISSIAPFIEGYEDFKEAVALQLFGGTDKVLSDDTHIRNTINILIVGDPGIGKSQILKHISRLAPGGIYASGKGASGVGLTAAVVSDETGGWTIEAGALVLGDRGFVCIDEFDKMKDDDRSYVHEGMEQGTVTITKAGIHTTLNARCSVLAAANPKFGRFDHYKAISEQINLPASLLSRFDLIYVVEDRPNIDKDALIAERIAQTHGNEHVDYPISPEMLKKYIAYSRKNIKPKITRETITTLKNHYVNMRQMGVDDESEHAIPITARQLEALIRLSEACAKAHLRKEITPDDANNAINLHNKCMQQVGYDPVSGQIDVDVVEGRHSNHERQILVKVQDRIDKLRAEYGKVPNDSILTEDISEKLGVSEEKALKYLMKVLRPSA